MGDFAGYDRCYCLIEEGCSSGDWGNYSLESRSCGKLYSAYSYHANIRIKAGSPALASQTTDALVKYGALDLRNYPLQYGFCGTPNGQ